MCFGFSQVYKIYDALLAVSWGLIFANTKLDAGMVDLFLRVLVHLQAGVWLWVYMFVSGCVCQSSTDMLSVWQSHFLLCIITLFYETQKMNL